MLAEQNRLIAGQHSATPPAEVTDGPALQTRIDAMYLCSVVLGDFEAISVRVGDFGFFEPAGRGPGAVRIVVPERAVPAGLGPDQRAAEAVLVGPGVSCPDVGAAGLVIRWSCVRA
jgi:hypothetical protein